MLNVILDLVCLVWFGVLEVLGWILDVLVWGLGLCVV